MPHIAPAHSFCLPKDVAHILSVLYQAGFEAYVVGGCVRDMLLHQTPLDYDIATSALPSEVSAIFERTIPTGLKHGTLTIMLHGVGYEVTSFRVDGEYSHFRAPKNVRFVRSLSEDVARRDFKMNALAYAPHSGLVDLVGGVEDVRGRRISCVGEARARLEEDALRILRALRFASTLGFEIEAHTHSAILACSPLLARISAERVRAELDKLLVGRHAHAVLTRYKGVLEVVLPELAGLDSKAWEGACARLVGLLEAEAHYPSCLAWAWLIGALRGDEAILKRLRFDKRGAERIIRVVRVAGQMEAFIESCARGSSRRGGSEARREVRGRRGAQKGEGLGKGEDRAGRIFCRKILSHNGIELCALALRLSAAGHSLQDTLESIYRTEGCLNLRTLALGGADIIALGVPQGRRVGEILENLLRAVIEERAPNTRDELLAYVGKSLAGQT